MVAASNAFPAPTFCSLGMVDTATNPSSEKKKTTRKYGQGPVCYTCVHDDTIMMVMMTTVIMMMMMKDRGAVCYRRVHDDVDD